MSLPLEELPDLDGATAVAASGGSNGDLMSHLLANQAQQTELLNKIHRDVLSTRTMISALEESNNELKEEIRKLKGEPKSITTNQEKEASIAAVAMTSLAGKTTDEEIDAIIEDRKSKQQWPVKHSTLNSFCVQEDLVKVRFHHSEKYQHIPVRIPKTEKNKDGTKPCKMCSEGRIRRKTTWMCAICEVPLCTRPLMDEDGSAVTHHTAWHSCRDLITEHKKCHEALKNGREMRKRARGDGGEDGDDRGGAMLKTEHVVQQV